MEDFFFLKKTNTKKIQALRPSHSLERKGRLPQLRPTKALWSTPRMAEQLRSQNWPMDALLVPL